MGVARSGLWAPGSKPIFRSKVAQSERQNLLKVARTAESCSKRQKLLKSCRAQSEKA